jgi:hypothetical protein
MKIASIEQKNLIYRTESKEKYFFVDVKFLSTQDCFQASAAPERSEQKSAAKKAKRIVETKKNTRQSRESWSRDKILRLCPSEYPFRKQSQIKPAVPHIKTLSRVSAFDKEF